MLQGAYMIKTIKRILIKLFTNKLELKSEYLELENKHLKRLLTRLEEDNESLQFYNDNLRNINLTLEDHNLSLQNSKDKLVDSFRNLCLDFLEKDQDFKGYVFVREQKDENRNKIYIFTNEDDPGFNNLNVIFKNSLKEVHVYNSYVIDECDVWLTKKILLKTISFNEIMSY